MSSFDDARSDLVVKIGTGLLRIKKEIPLEDYPQILNLFSKYVKGEKTYTEEEFEETPDPQFEFLNFLQPAYIASDKLDATLIQQMFSVYKKKQEQKIQFRHKFLDDYLNMNSKCEIQYGPRKNFIL